MDYEIKKNLSISLPIGRYLNQNDRLDPEKFPGWIDKIGSDLFARCKNETEEAEIVRFMGFCCQAHDYDEASIKGICQKAKLTARLLGKCDAAGQTSAKAERTKENRPKQEADGGFGQTVDEEETPLLWLAPPPPFPIDVFPKQVQDALWDIALHFGVPVDLAAVCFLGLVSALLGQNRLISTTTDWIEGANLWLVYVAPASFGKTILLDCIHGRLNILQERAFEQYRKDYLAWQANSQKTAAGENEEKPIRKIITTNDFTPDVLPSLMYENRRGIHLVVDDMYGIMRVMGRFGGSGNSDAFRMSILKAWSRSRFSVARKTSLGAEMAHGCLGFSGFIQDDLLKDCFDYRTEEASGLFARFLILSGSKLLDNDRAATPLAASTRELLDFVTDSFWAWDEQEICSLSPEAKERFFAWRGQMLVKARSVDNATAARLLKGISYGLRLTLIIHCLDILFGGAPASVRLACLERGLRLADYLIARNLASMALYNGQNAVALNERQLAIMDAIVTIIKTRHGTNYETLDALRLRLQAGDIAAFLSKRKLCFTTPLIGLECKKLGLEAVKSGVRYYALNAVKLREFEKILDLYARQHVQHVQHVQKAIKSSSCEEINMSVTCPQPVRMDGAASNSQNGQVVACGKKKAKQAPDGQFSFAPLLDLPVGTGLDRSKINSSAAES